MNIQEIAPGLWRWTGRHPDWKPEEGGPAGWDEEVGCFYYEAPNAIVLIDPLVPPEDSKRIYEALDRDRKRIGRPVAILLTVFWHERSARELVERYGATLWAHPASVEKRGLPVTAESLPDGVVARDVGRLGEVAFWLPSHRALLSGDVLLGAEGGGLRVCSPSWVRQGGYPALLESLRGLLELPIESVLVSHGTSVIAGGREAMERAIEKAAAENLPGTA